MQPVNEGANRRLSLGDIVEQTRLNRVGQQAERGKATEEGWSRVEIEKAGVRVTYTLPEPDGVNIFALKNFSRHGGLVELFESIFTYDLMARKLEDLRQDDPGVGKAFFSLSDSESFFFPMSSFGRSVERRGTQLCAL